MKTNNEWHELLTQDTQTRKVLLQFPSNNMHVKQGRDIQEMQLLRVDCFLFYKSFECKLEVREEKSESLSSKTSTPSVQEKGEVNKKTLTGKMACIAFNPTVKG